jgi:ubiquinone/menaquinone biosynthesis C-methylase UbiE
MSYWHQVNEIAMHEDVKSVLDVGPGTDFLKSNLKVFRPEIKYVSLDFAKDVSPDIVGEVTNIPSQEGSYDLVSAFQVLEHIKFSDFELALSEISRVTKKYAVISLPDSSPTVFFQLKIPMIPLIKFAFKIPFYKKHEFNGQHYWEVGKAGYSNKSILSIMSKHFDIKKHFVPFENQYHRFYILEKK